MKVLRRLSDARRSLSPTGWILSAVVIALLFGVAWWAATEPARQRARAVAAEVSGAMGQARGASASEAADVADRARDDAAQSESLSRENADEIHSAPGADQRLDPELNDVGRRGLCERAAYRRSVECVQLLGAAVP